MKTSFRVSLGGIIGALSIILMFMTSVVPFGTFAFPAFAGMLLIGIVIELGLCWALVVYGIVSAMSVFLVADKEAVLFYVAFLGFYPVVKGIIEKINNLVVQYIVKFILFNACVISAFYVSITLLNIPLESFTIFSVYLPWVFLVLGNIAFVIYDLCVTKMVVFYMLKLHHILSKKTKL